MANQYYEDYWKLTNAFTDYNGKKFLDTLSVCIEFIDQFKEEEDSEEIYGNPKCVLERLSYPVLIASHIKPFINSDENEAYDPNNGLLLSRTIDSLFDLKYISFTDEGEMIFSSRISNDVKDFWKDYKLENTILNEQRKGYLAYHRNLMTEIDANA